VMRRSEHKKTTQKDKNMHHFCTYYTVGSAKRTEIALAIAAHGAATPEERNTTPSQAAERVAPTPMAKRTLT